MSAEVVCVGELMVDMLPEDASARYQAIAGGAPANVAVALAKLGHQVGMAGRVGNDRLGDLLTAHLDEAGVGLDLLVKDGDAPSDVTIVEPASVGSGFRCYLMGRTGWIGPAVGAAVEKASLLHFGSLLGANPAGRELMAQAIDVSRRAAIVSLDANLRTSAWGSAEDMISQTRRLIEVVDVVKATRDELDQLGLSDSDLRWQSEKVWLVTDGASPAMVVAGDCVEVRMPPQVAVVDPTGGGDASFAAFLHTLISRGWRPARSGGGAPGRELVHRALAAAVAAGSRVVQHPGASAGLPEAADLAWDRLNADER